ncbi:twin-arginine translocase TatA/TatE family subunit, partial [Cellulomonas endophytica]|uniref:twin-arginine translocase TatA/TatE family subunit n=1 Tax=Cellulomonas endophytica TaxID=2494735 RepID=UPI0010121801
MFDINGGEWLVLLLVAVVVIGPERLPAFAEQLAGWVRGARRFLRDAKQRVDEELGEEARDIDWASLDPRQYDPRRIVREALLEDLPARPSPTNPRGGGVSRAAAGATAAAAGAAAGGTPAGTPGGATTTGPRSSAR